MYIKLYSYWVLYLQLLLAPLQKKKGIFSFFNSFLLKIEIYHDRTKIINVPILYFIPEKSILVETEHNMYISS